MIRRNATFRARLERLERKHRRDPLPRIFLAICPQDSPGPIVGFKAGNLYVEREAGESEASLRERAAATGAPFLIAVYAERPLSATERTDSRSPSPAPVEPSGTLSGNPRQPDHATERTATMKDLATRRLSRAARRYPDAPTPEAALAHAEGASRFDAYALGGIGTVKPSVGKLKP